MNTPTSGAAIQRYNIGYASDDWGMRSSTPSGIPDASGSWVRYADHVAALAAGQAVAPADGWLQDGGLLYRLTDERHPCNRDEINVTMADGSRSIASRSRRALELLDRIRAVRPAPPAMDGARLDNCTDPYNCNRCKAHPNHRAGLEHAGISAARAAQKEGEAS